MASNFLASTTAGAKDSPFPKLNKFSFLKTETMLFDVMVWTAGLYQDKITWMANKNRLKNGSIAKIKNKTAVSMNQISTLQMSLSQKQNDYWIFSTFIFNFKISSLDLKDCINLFFSLLAWQISLIFFLLWFHFD